MKKTFDINKIFNIIDDNKCLEEVLEEVVKEEQLDQQDVMDIVVLSSENFSRLIQFYNGRKGSGNAGYRNNLYPRPLGPNFSMQPMSGMDMSRNYSGHGESPWIKTYSSTEYPEFFEKLFGLSSFVITYHNTVLSDDFKFVGVEGDYLTYLGRDKELALVAGSATFHYGRLEVSLACMGINGQIRINPTPATDDMLRQSMQDGALPIPGLTPTSSATRELMEHIRSQAWRTLTEGDLVVRIDEPEQVYLLSHTVDDMGPQAQLMVIPVTITTNDEGIVATPIPSGVVTVDRVFLKRYKHQA